MPSAATCHDPVLPGARPRRRDRRSWTTRTALAVGAAVVVAVVTAGCAGSGGDDPDLAAPPGRAAPPAGGASPGADAVASGGVPEVFRTGDLVAVRVRVEVSIVGVTEWWELTTDEVLAAGDGTFRLATCGPWNAAAGLVGGYAVATVDTGATGTIARFEVVPVGDVAAAGTYPAIGSWQSTEGASYPLDGEMSVHDGLLTGEFLLHDPAGNAVTGDYECVAR